MERSQENVVDSSASSTSAAPVLSSPASAVSVAIRSFLLHQETPGIPAVYSINHSILYVLLDVPERFCLIGPMKTDSAAAIPNDFTCADVPEEWKRGLTRVFTPVLTTHVLLIHNLFHEPEITESVFLKQCFPAPKMEEKVRRRFAEVQFSRQEHGGAHNPYTQEQRLMEAIAAGCIMRPPFPCLMPMPGKLKR